MSRRPARATRAEIRRALEAAREAGIDVIVDILPNGTIRLCRKQETEPPDIGLSPGLVL